MKMTIAD